MKKLFFIFLLVIPLVSAISISEVESNPPGIDSGNEWVEFFSEIQINNSEYTIQNNDGQELILNLSFQGYFVYVFKIQWLDNTDEKISLYENNELLDSTSIFKDTKDNSLTFSYCENWEFLESSKQEENNCPIEESLEGQEREEDSGLNEPAKIEEIKQTLKISPEITKKKSEIIFLNPQTIKSKETNSNLESKWFMKYSFGIFCVIILFLFLLKKKKPKNEWTN